MSSTNLVAVLSLLFFTIITFAQDPEVPIQGDEDFSASGMGKLIPMSGTVEDDSAGDDLEGGESLKTGVRTYGEMRGESGGG